MANESLEVAIGEDGNGSNKLIEAINRLTAGLDKVADASDKSGKGLKGYGDNAKTAATSSASLAGSVDKAKAGFGGLASALSGITALLSASKLIKYADEYTGISQKLKLVTTDQTKLNAIIEQSYGIAQRNSTGLADTAKLYGQLSGVYKSIGKDQTDVAKTTETITQAISLTGPSSEEAANGLRQFNQGLSSGVLRGDEFNSVMENTPGLAKAIAAGFSSAGPITTGELRKLAEEGALTGKALVEALERAGPNVAKLAQSSTDTVAKAFTRLENAVLKFVGQSNEAYGVTQLVAKGIDLVTNNIGPAIIAVTAFAAILAAGALAGAVSSIANLAKGFYALTTAVNINSLALLKNPMVLAGTLIAIAGAIAALKLTGTTFSDVTAKIGGYLTKADQAILGTGQLGTAGTAAAPGIAAAGTAAQTAATGATALNTANAAAPAAAALATTAYGGLLGSATKVGASLADVSGRAKEIPPAIAAAATGAATAALGFGTLQLNATATGAGIAAVTASAMLLNPALGAVNGALTNSGIQAQATSASMFKLADDKKRVNDAGSALGPTLQKVADASKGAAGAAVDLSKGAEEARLAMEAQAKASEEGKKAAEAFKTALEKLNGAFNSMGEKIESAEEAVKRFADALQKKNERIQKSLENLKQYYSAADTATTATNSLGSAVSSIGGGFTDLANDTALATSQLTAFTQAANAAAVASSNASQGLSIRQQLNADESNASQRRAEAGTGTSRSGSRVTVSAGNGDGSVNSMSYDVYSVGGIDVASTMDPELQRIAMGSEKHAQKYGMNGWNLYLARNQFTTTGPDFNPEAIWQGFLRGGGSDAITNPALIKKPNMMNSGFFAHGGSFMVGGNGGTDSQPVSFMASPNERVTIETPAQQMQRDQADNVGNGRRREQPVTIVMNVKTDDVDSFKRSKKQIAQDMFGRLGRAM